KILPVLRSLVLAVQEKSWTNRIWDGLAALGRIREDFRHDRRKHGPGSDETAAQALGVSLQTGLAKTDHHDRGRDGEPAAWVLHFCDDPVYLGGRIPACAEPDLWRVCG